MTGSIEVREARGTERMTRILGGTSTGSETSAEGNIPSNVSELMLALRCCCFRMAIMSGSGVSTCGISNSMEPLFEQEHSA